MKLFKRFKKKKTRLSIIEVDYAKGELDNFTDVISDMTERRLDAVLIRNFLPKENTDALIAGFENIKKEELIEVEEGFLTYPIPFSTFSQMFLDSRETYDECLRKSERIWNNFSEDYGFDFYAHLKKELESISGSRSISSVPGQGGVGHFHPAGFKKLSPDKGRFTVHCGNFFHKEFPNFFDHLKTILPIENQLSYFVTLQSSAMGGEIVLYDVTWDEAEKRPGGGTSILKKDGTELRLSDEKRLKRAVLKPNTGDLLLFASSRIWHSVNMPKGNERYTLGGFIANGHDHDKSFLWS